VNGPGRGNTVRTCVGCRKRAEQAGLVRLAIEENRVIVSGKETGGRGAWLHAREECLRAALDRRALTRALRRPGAEIDEAALRAGLTGNARRD